MNLSKIARAVNQLCLELAPPPGAVPPTPWGGLAHDQVWVDECREISPAVWEELERARRIVHEHSGMPPVTVVPSEPDWVRDLSGPGGPLQFELPPAWKSSLEDYKASLFKGEIGYILEHRFVQNAGPRVRWISREDAEVAYSSKAESTRPWKPSGWWCRVGAMPPVFLPDTLTLEDVQAACGPDFTCRRITEEEARVLLWMQ
jgi:hypothetical protein